jgi:hypothetical protein
VDVGRLITLPDELRGGWAIECAQGVTNLDQNCFSDPDFGGVAHARQKGFSFVVILITLVE